MLNWIVTTIFGLLFARLTYMIFFEPTGVIDSWRKEDYSEVATCLVVGLLTAVLAIGGLIFHYGI